MSATATQTTAPRTADFVALHEDQYLHLVQAKEAIECLAHIHVQYADGVAGNPSKDGNIGIPADKMASLLSCISNSINHSAFMTVTALLKTTLE